MSLLMSNDEICRDYRLSKNKNHQVLAAVAGRGRGRKNGMTERSRKTMTNEQKVEAYRMRLEGQTLQAIADRFGVSKQRVHQFLPPTRGKVDQAVESCIYPAISKWMLENEAGFSEIARRADADGNVIYQALIGKTANPTKKTIDAVLSVTGLSYEEAFGEVRKEKEA